YHTIVADATGFGYDDTVKLSYLRGRQIREVKSHIKTEVLIGVISITGGYIGMAGIRWSSYLAM
ncbi:MAG: hypothetical protein N2648_06640, partial [Aquificaceae bacterium]|nr:hypothetical protein [Aquificaceae bacterium]